MLREVLDLAEFLYPEAKQPSSIVGDAVRGGKQSYALVSELSRIRVGLPL